MAVKKYEVTGREPAGVTGKPVGTDINSSVDLLKGGMEQMDGSGTQSGSHPAKSQSKVMRYFE